jgi:hypothetical protein
MTLRTVLIAIVLLALPTLARAAEETRDVPAFTAVKFTGVAHLVLAVGKEQSLKLDADRDVLGEVTTEVKSGTLEIRRRDRHKSRWSFFGFLQWLGSSGGQERAGDNLTITIAAPKLSALSISGAAKVDADGFDGGDTAIVIAGASDLHASGRLDHLVLTISGAGNAKLGDLVTTAAVVSLTGAGNVVVQPKQSLHAEISGMGAVRYIGDPPDITRNITGMGTIQKQ